MAIKKVEYEVIPPHLVPCECGGTARYEKRKTCDGYRYWVMCQQCERTVDEADSCEEVRKAWLELNSRTLRGQCIQLREAWIDLVGQVAKMLRLREICDWLKRSLENLQKQIDKLR